MIHRFLLLSVLNLACSCLFAQGEWNNWIFGVNIGLSFQTNPPSIFNGAATFSTGGMAVASDSSGQLLFYSNGMEVYNRNHTLMLNGSGLFCANAQFMHPLYTAQSIEDSYKYYLFTIAILPSIGYYRMYYSMIDIRLDNGLGAVIEGQKNIPVVGGDGVVDAIMGIRHANKRDFWLIAQDYGNINGTNHYMAFLVDKSGIHEPVISNSSVPYSIAGASYSIAMDQSGTRLVSQFGGYLLEYCNFNSLTGVITPTFTFHFPQLGVSDMPSCFSWSGKKLYVSRREYGFNPMKYALYQFDTSIADSALFADSRVKLCECKYYGVLGLGKDSKIYLTERDDGQSPYNNDSLGVINKPELAGTACDFQASSFGLQGKQSQPGLPRFLQRYFAYINHSGFCQGASICFEPNTWPPPDSLWWDFGDPSSGVANFSNDSTPEHIFNTPGIYTVKMIVRHVDMRYDTATLNLTIEPQPMPNLGPDRMVCQDQPVILNAGFNPQWTYLWSTGETTPTITVTNTGTYSVTVTSPNGCTGSDEVVLSIIPGSTPEPKPIKHN